MFFLGITVVGVIAFLLGRASAPQASAPQASAPQASALPRTLPSHIPYGTLITTDSARLRQLEESKRPIGEASRGMTVSALTKFDLPDPFISFTIINDGPNSVYLEINSDTRPSRVSAIRINESYSYDAIYPIIKSITFDVDSGETAAIRLRAKTGRLS